MTNRIHYVYWGLTAALCLFMVFNGLSDLACVDVVARDLLQLGYPAYLASLLGAAKLLGVIALGVPGLPRLKEWAYAGFSFDKYVIAGSAISGAA